MAPCASRNLSRRSAGSDFGRPRESAVRSRPIVHRGGVRVGGYIIVIIRCGTLKVNAVNSSNINIVP